MIPRTSNRRLYGGRAAAGVPLRLLLVSVAAAVHGGCSRTSREATGADVIKVFVSIEPQAYVVDRIGGARVETAVLVGAGRSPATYEPTPKQMAALSRADIYFSTGVPFEAVLVPKVRAAAPQLGIVDTLALPDMEPRHLAAHADHGHEASALDPHVWLDPLRLKKQARVIARELARRDPSHRDLFERNLQRLRRDLDDAHRRIAERLAPFRGETFYVFHPAFGYFGERYGLRQAAIEVEGKEPSVRQLGTFVERARRDGVKAIFVQAQFTRQSAEKIAEAIGATVVVLDPLARDCLSNLDGMAAAIAQALGGRGG